jgi:signal transduction histidine kinase
VSTLFKIVKRAVTVLWSRFLRIVTVVTGVVSLIGIFYQPIERQIRGVSDAWPSWVGFIPIAMLLTYAFVRAAVELIHEGEEENKNLKQAASKREDYANTVNKQTLADTSRDLAGTLRDRVASETELRESEKIARKQRDEYQEKCRNLEIEVAKLKEKLGQQNI